MPAPIAAWTHQFGSPAWDRANGVTVDRQGNIIVAGATQGALPGQTLGGDWDAYLKKLSPAGAELWTRQFTNSVSVGVLALTADGTGNIIAVGHTVGPLPGQTGAGVDDAYVRKLSPAGTELWTHQFGSAAAEWAFGVALDASGNIIVVGATDGAFPGQTNAGYEDAWVRKLSPAGAELWTRQFGSPDLDRASGVAVDTSGNIILAGRTQGAPLEVDPVEEGIPAAASASSSDAVVRKLSPEGVELWTIRFGSPSFAEASAVAVDGTGNIIVVGHTVGALPGQTRVGYDDAFLRKLSPAGAELWTRQFGSAIYAGALAVAVDGAGNIIVAGHIWGALPGQTRAGLYDAFVREFSPAGDELWTIQFGSPNRDGASGVAVDAAGNIIVAGETYGALPGQTDAGLGDGFVIALAPEAPSAPQPTRISVVFHPDFYQVYSSANEAFAPGRMASITKELEGFYDFVEPKPASEEDLRRVHTQQHIDSVKLNPKLYEVARLAAGGAILAGELAAAGEPAFALITPPSHHAGPDSYIGYCYLNNVAVAIRKLIDENKIQTALVIDFDFHFGEGTAELFRDDGRVAYFWLPVEGTRTQQLAALEEYLRQATNYDILAVSAGFDRAREERGGVFETEDYTTIGRLLKGAAERNSQGRRFAALEGGYNHQVLGKNVKAFLQGFQ